MKELSALPNSAFAAMLHVTAMTKLLQIVLPLSTAAQQALLDSNLQIRDC